MCVIAAVCRTFEELAEERLVHHPGLTCALHQGRILVQGHCHQRSLVGIGPTLRLWFRISMEAILVATPIPFHLVETEDTPAPSAAFAPPRPRRERTPAVRAQVRLRRYRWYPPLKDALDVVAAVMIGLFAVPVIVASVRV